MTMTTQQLAKKWNMSPGSLANWRCYGRGPKFVKLGRKIVYKQKDIEKFEKANGNK